MGVLLMIGMVKVVQMLIMVWILVEKGKRIHILVLMVKVWEKAMLVEMVGMLHILVGDKKLWVEMVLLEKMGKTVPIPALVNLRTPTWESIPLRSAQTMLMNMILQNRKIIIKILSFMLMYNSKIFP